MGPVGWGNAWKITFVGLALLGCSCMDRSVGSPPLLERDAPLPEFPETPPPPLCDRCPDGTVCFNGVCVGQGMLRVSLAFSVDSDFDLHLITPGGSEIYFVNTTADGGYLDVDTCVSPCGDGIHVENIFFEESPPSGVYEVWVENYDGRNAGSFEIELSLMDGIFASGELEAERQLRSAVFEFEY